MNIQQTCLDTTRVLHNLVLMPPKTSLTCLPVGDWNRPVLLKYPNLSANWERLTPPLVCLVFAQTSVPLLKISGPMVIHICIFFLGSSVCLYIYSRNKRFRHKKRNSRTTLWSPGLCSSFSFIASSTVTQSFSSVVVICNTALDDSRGGS